jgi:uncharacterized membrane protein YhaH (DUF805 family)
MRWGTLQNGHKENRQQLYQRSHRSLFWTPRTWLAVPYLVKCTRRIVHTQKDCHTGLFSSHSFFLKFTQYTSVKPKHKRRFNQSKALQRPEKKTNSSSLKEMSQRSPSSRRHLYSVCIFFFFFLPFPFPLFTVCLRRCRVFSFYSILTLLFFFFFVWIHLSSLTSILPCFNIAYKWIPTRDLILIGHNLVTIS